MAEQNGLKVWKVESSSYSSFTDGILSPVGASLHYNVDAFVLCYHSYYKYIYGASGLHRLF